MKTKTEFTTPFGTVKKSRQGTVERTGLFGLWDAFKAATRFTNMIDIRDVTFIPYRIQTSHVNDKPLSKSVKLNDKFMRFYFRKDNAKTRTGQVILNTSYDTKKREGIVTIKTKTSPLANLRNLYGNANKQAWRGIDADDTWMGGDLYEIQNKEIAPSLKKLKKIGNDTWEATFVPYELAADFVEAVPLTKSEQKLGTTIMQHILKPKNGWFQHTYNMVKGVGHARIIFPANNVLSAKRLRGINGKVKNFTYLHDDVYQNGTDLYILKIKNVKRP